MITDISTIMKNVCFIACSIMLLQNSRQLPVYRKRMRINLKIGLWSSSEPDLHVIFCLILQHFSLLDSTQLSADQKVEYHYPFQCEKKTKRLRSERSFNTAVLANPAFIKTCSVSAPKASLISTIPNPCEDKVLAAICAIAS